MIDRLKKYFKERHDVAFVFIYKPEASGTDAALSDVNIAIYYYPQPRYPIEFQGASHYKNEKLIWIDLEDLLGQEVELLVLNRASAADAANALRGEPIVISDWGLYMDFIEAISFEIEDFEGFVIRDGEDGEVSGGNFGENPTSQIME